MGSFPHGYARWIQRISETFQLECQANAMQWQLKLWVEDLCDSTQTKATSLRWLLAECCTFIVADVVTANIVFEMNNPELHSVWAFQAVTGDQKRCRVTVKTLFYRWSLRYDKTDKNLKGSSALSRLRKLLIEFKEVNSSPLLHRSRRLWLIPDWLPCCGRCWIRGGAWVGFHWLTTTAFISNPQQFMCYM